LPDSQNPASRRRPSRRRIGFIIVLALLAGATAYAVIERPWEEKPTQLAVERVEAGPVTQVLAVNGRVAARNSVTVRSAVSAKALTVAVEVGDSVAEGQLLAQLDAAVAEAQVKQAEAALQAQLVSQRQAEAVSARADALGENATRSTREDAALALAGAINQTTRLQGALDEANRQLEQYSIESPIAGVVLSRDVDQGQLVDAQTELFVVADTSDLVVETDVDELYSSQISTGLAALLRPVGHTLARPGTVVFAAPTVDAATGGRATRIAFDEPLSLPVGLTVNANIIVNEVADALSVSRSALVTEGTTSRVLVIENGLVAARMVEFSDWPAERVIVTSGLAAGDVVILDPQGVEPGSKAVAAN
jgi:RND family efflux transporter MFP subunit